MRLKDTEFAVVFSLHNTHTNRDHNGTGTRVCKVVVDCGKTLSYLLSEYLITPIPPLALASQQCKKNSARTVQQLGGTCDHPRRYRIQ